MENVECSPQSATVQVNVRDNFGSICSRGGVDDDVFVVDNDDSFLDEGVHVVVSCRSPSMRGVGTQQVQ